MTDKQSTHEVCCKYFFGVVLLYLVFRLFLNGMIPLLDTSESRYAVISRNMYESGNFFTPSFILDGKLTTYSGKPAFAFHCNVVSANLFGMSEFSMRFSAFVSAVAILCMLGYVGKKLRNTKTAIFAILFCVTTVVFYLYAGLCMTDMLLTAAVTGSVLAMIMILSTDQVRHQKMYSLAMFGFLGLGMIIKGPVAIVLTGLPTFFYLLLTGRWAVLKRLTWIRGILLFLAITVPFYGMTEIRNPDFLEYFFINENFGRFLFQDYGDQFGSGRRTFRGMALIMFLLVNLPTICFCPLLYRTSEVNKSWRQYYADPLTGMTLTAFISITLFWSLSEHILITYLLPTIPFFCLWLTVRLNDSGWFENVAFIAYLKYSSLIFSIILFSGFLIAVQIAQRTTNSMPAPVYRHVLDQVKSHPDLVDKTFYFEVKTPFSAEYYLGDRVRNHPHETREESMKNSENSILFVRGRTNVTDRDKLAQIGKWTVYLPKPGDRTRADLPIVFPEDKLDKGRLL